MILIDLPMESVINDYQVEDMTVYELAKKYYVSYTTIKRRLRELGLLKRKKITGIYGKEFNPVRKAGPKEIERLYYEEKMNCTEIGLLYGVSNTTVLNYMKENNIPRRKQGEKRK